MTAEAIAKALGGRKTGATWMARCPAHEDRTPSLSITDGDNSKVLVRCYAGCDQLDVIRRASSARRLGKCRPVRKPILAQRRSQPSRRT
jgi:putative DNA primase/helicase